MKRKFLAMTMAITVSLSGIGSWQPQVQAAEITTGDEQAETEDLSPYVLQEGGSLIQTPPPAMELFL